MQPSAPFFHTAARIAAAALVLCATGAVQAGKLGSPTYSMSTVSLDSTLSATTPLKFVDSQHHATANGDLVSGVIWYATPTQRAESVGGGIFNHGVTFWIMGRTPFYFGDLPRPADSIVGGQSRIDIWQSYRKERADAEATFLYSAASMQLMRSIEGGPRPCEDCILGRVGWTAEVYLNELVGPPLRSQTQTATLSDRNGILKLLIDDHNTGIGMNNPTWQWDCERCDGSSYGLGTALLQTPYRGSVDLSGIRFDPSLPASEQNEFTVHMTMDWLAYDQSQYGNMSVFTRDPLGGADSGVGLDIAGLIPTDNPIGVVPEPGTWALMFAGLVLVGLNARRRWRQVPSSCTSLANTFLQSGSASAVNPAQQAWQSGEAGVTDGAEPQVHRPPAFAATHSLKS